MTLARVELRRLAPDEVELHRDLRLRALRDAPDSFGETAAEAAARSRAYWEELTRAVTAPGGQAMFVACEDEHAVGTVYALLDRERREAGRVGGMWVEAAWRGQGVGRSLLLEVLGWARARGLARLGLWAPAHSPAAIALYSRAGFRDTGARRTLPGNASVHLIAMEVEL